jgi:hypothetical protein
VRRDIECTLSITLQTFAYAEKLRSDQNIRVNSKWFSQFGSTDVKNLEIVFLPLSSEGGGGITKGLKGGGMGLLRRFGKGGGMITKGLRGEEVVFLKGLWHYHYLGREGG